MSPETELNKEGRREGQWKMRSKLRSRLDRSANEYRMLKKPTWNDHLVQGDQPSNRDQTWKSEKTEGCRE